MSHYKPYPACKDSGVEWLGKVPEHWEPVPIKTVIAHIESGTSVNAVDSPAINEQIGVLKTSCVYLGEFNPNENKAILPEEYERVSCPVASDTLIVSRMNTPELVGAAGVVHGNHPNLFLPDRLWQVHMREVNPYFVHYWTLTRIYRHQVERACAGTSSSMQNLTQDDFKGFVFPRASLSEQSTIVTHLNRETTRIDTLIAKKTRFIELLTEKRQALITQVVTKGLNPNVKMKDSGVEWLGEVPEHWEVVRFRDMCASISTGPFGTALGNEDYVSEGIPVINPSHIVNSQIVSDSEVSVSESTAQRLKFWRLDAGDIIAARRGELGRAAIVSSECQGWICGTGSLRVKPRLSRITVTYLHTVLQSSYAREWLNQSSVGATMANLNEGILGNLPVAAPIRISEQIELIDQMLAMTDQVDEIISKTQLSINLLKERRSALITAAVTGQIDLREAA